VSISTWTTVVMADGVDGGSRFNVRYRLHAVACCLGRAADFDGFLQHQLVGTDELSDATVAVREHDAVANLFVCLRAVLTGLGMLSMRCDERIDALACRRNELVKPVPLIDLVLLRHTVVWISSTFLLASTLVNWNPRYTIRADSPITCRKLVYCTSLDFYVSPDAIAYSS